ncbi:Hpt domain-containing protein [Planctomicrobium sp. SH664]|uniref:Hpt domain-containing protein n=1 Tax=Planctomicrobium sp. SH664 TaxID=3448125 RepID=UPI003F5B6465
MSSEFVNSLQSSAPIREPEVATINIRAALERLGEDEGLLRDMAEFYLEDVPPLLVEIEQALQAGNSEVVMRAAHSIKGLSSNFDGDAATAAARVIELSGKANDLGSASEALPRLKAEVQLVIAALKAQVLVSPNEP